MFREGGMVESDGFGCRPSKEVNYSHPMDNDTKAEDR